MEGSQRAEHLTSMLPKTHHCQYNLDASMRTHLRGNNGATSCLQRGHQNNERGDIHIALTEDAKQFNVNIKAELDLVQSQGITARSLSSRSGVHLSWSCTKDMYDIWMCVDLSRLNKYVRRERYQSATTAQAIADIAANNAKGFIKLDAIG